MSTVEAPAKETKNLFLDEMGVIPNSAALPAAPEGGGTRAATIIGAQATRLMGPKGESGFVLALTAQYSGQAQPVLGVLVGLGDGVLTVRGNLFCQIHAESGKPLAQTFKEKLLDPDKVTPADFINKHWQVMEPLSEFDFTWAAMGALLSDMAPKLFARMQENPEGDPLPGVPMANQAAPPTTDDRPEFDGELLKLAKVAPNDYGRALCRVAERAKDVPATTASE